MYRMKCWNIWRELCHLLTKFNQYRRIQDRKLYGLNNLYDPVLFFYYLTTLLWFLRIRFMIFSLYQNTKCLLDKLFFQVWIGHLSLRLSERIRGMKLNKGTLLTVLEIRSLFHRGILVAVFINLFTGSCSL